MEQERPPDTSKNKGRKKTLEGTGTAYGGNGARFGDWHQRCVIGHSEKRYLKYPEARYNPLASISGDLLVAALYAGSVDVESGNHAARSNAISSILVGSPNLRSQGLPSTRSSTPDNTGSYSPAGSRRTSTSARRKAESGIYHATSLYNSFAIHSDACGSCNKVSSICHRQFLSSFDFAPMYYGI